MTFSIEWPHEQYFISIACTSCDRKNYDPWNEFLWKIIKIKINFHSYFRSESIVHTIFAEFNSLNRAHWIRINRWLVIKIIHSRQYFWLFGCHAILRILYANHPDMWFAYITYIVRLIIWNENSRNKNIFTWDTKNRKTYFSYMFI